MTESQHHAVTDAFHPAHMGSMVTLGTSTHISEASPGTKHFTAPRNLPWRGTSRLDQIDSLRAEALRLQGRINAIRLCKDALSLNVSETANA